MADLAATAERLRVVKQAYQHFLTLWALDRLMTQPASATRFHADIESATEEEAVEQDPVGDPHNRDWSLLYRGSVLDD